MLFANSLRFLALLCLMIAPLWASATPAPAPTAPEPETEIEAAPTVDPRVELQARLEQLTAEIAEQEALLAEGQNTGIEQRLGLLRDILATIQQHIGVYTRMDQQTSELEEVQAQRALFEQEGLPDEPPYPLARLDALEDEAISAARVMQVAQVEIRTVRALLSQGERAYADAQQTVRRVREESLQGSTGQIELRIALLRERRAEQELALQRIRLESLQQREAIWNARTQLFRAQAQKVRPHVAFEEEGLEQRLADIATRRTDLEASLRRLERERTENDASLSRARMALASTQQSEDTDSVPRLQERVVAREAWLDASTEGVQYLERRLAGLYDEERMWQRRHAVLNRLTPEEYEDWAVETNSLKATLGDIRGFVETRVNELRTSQLDLENRANNAPESIADIEAHQTRLEALQAMETHARAYLTNIAGRQSLATRLSIDIDAQIETQSVRDRLARVWAQALILWNRELFVIDDRPFTMGRIGPASVVFLLVLVGVYLAKLFLMKVVLRRLVRDTHEFSSIARDVVLALSKSTSRTFVLILALYAASGMLPLSLRIETLIATLMTIAFFAQLGIWINDIMQRMLEASKRKREAKDPSSVSAFGLFSVFGRIAIWAVVLLFVLRSLNYDITAVIAGLGIGGIAVAFALQNILGDIFCSVAILLDKPFVVGDFIVVGDQKGSVEHIGIKTTRIRSLSGEQIIFSNADLMGSRIQNFKRMYERRVGFEFGIVYETPREKVARIPGIVRAIIEECEDARFDRSHFARFGDFSLDFDTIYYVGSPDFAKYMDIQQHVNLELIRIFEEEGIAFAYPTRELILRGFPGKQGAPAPLSETSNPETPTPEQA